MSPRLWRPPLQGQDIRSGGLVLGIDEVMIVVVTAILTLAFLSVFLAQPDRAGDAGRVPEPVGRLLHGHPCQSGFTVLSGGLSGMVAAVAGILFASKGAIDPVDRVAWHQSVCGRCDWWFRLIARCLAWWVDHRIGRAAGLALWPSRREPDRTLTRSCCSS